MTECPAKLYLNVRSSRRQAGPAMPSDQRGESLEGPLLRAFSRLVGGLANDSDTDSTKR